MRGAWRLELACDVNVNIEAVTNFKSDDTSLRCGFASIAISQIFKIVSTGPCLVLMKNSILLQNLLDNFLIVKD